MTRASSLPPDYTIRQVRNIDIPVAINCELISWK